jgi:hypothetical protein
MNSDIDHKGYIVIGMLAGRNNLPCEATSRPVWESPTVHEQVPFCAYVSRDALWMLHTIR